MPLIRERSHGGIALFSTDAHHEAFREHVEKDGVGATVEAGWIVLYDRSLRFALCQLTQVPIAFGGKARFNVANALAAALATYVTKIPVFDIGTGLQSFFQSTATTPGRINMVNFGDVRLLIDYAHNAAALASLCELVRELRNGRLIAVFGLPGDRRDHDLRQSSRPIAATFDRVIIREDRDLRDRAPGETAAIIHATLREAGMREEQIVERHDERDALRLALGEARPGDLIVFIVDEAEEGLALVDELRRARSAAVADAVH
jgi:cyanophycin synthetase